MNKVVPTLFLLLALGGCSQWNAIRDIAAGDEDATTTLEGIRRTVAVGEIVTASRPLRVARTVRLDEELLATTKHRDTPMLVRLQPGEYRFVTEKGGAQYFSAPGPFPTSRGDEELPGHGGMVVVEGAPVGAYWLWSPVHNPALAYTARVVSAPMLTEGMSQQLLPDADPETETLRYAGMRDDQLLFVYRTAADADAAGAEIALSCERGRTCSFRDAMFVVHEADAEKLDYSLIKSL